MKLITFLLLSVIVLLADPAFAADPAPAAPPKTIAMLGDSVTFQGKWEEVLGRTDVVNWGLSMLTTGQLAWTFKDLLCAYPELKVVFLQGGINDLTLGVPADRVYDNYVNAVTWWRKRSVVPVVQSVIYHADAPEMNATIKAINQRLREYCESNHVEFLDLNAALGINGHLRPELTSDGTHLQPAAYPLWAELVKASLGRSAQ